MGKFPFPTKFTFLKRIVAIEMLYLMFFQGFLLQPLKRTQVDENRKMRQPIIYKGYRFVFCDLSLSTNPENVRTFNCGVGL